MMPPMTTYGRLLLALCASFMVLTGSACVTAGECTNQVVLLDGGTYSHFANAQGCAGTGVYRCAEVDAGVPGWASTCDCSVDGGLCQQNR